MSYAFYNTPGLVLEKKETGEGKFTVGILTEAFGFVFADARGLSSTLSRLKYSLDALTEGEYSFVRGKHGWKLVNGKSVHYWYSGNIKEKEKSDTVSRVCNLLYGLVPRDQVESDVYKLAVDFLKDINEAKKEHISLLEIFYVYKILEVLGYIEGVDIPHSNWQSDSVLVLEEKRGVIVKKINEALSSVHLYF